MSSTPCSEDFVLLLALDLLDRHTSGELAKARQPAAALDPPRMRAS